MRWLVMLALTAFASTSDAATDPPAAPGLSADQIVSRNIAARGGLDAWQKIQSMTWAGHIEQGNTPASSLPFILEQKRPNRTRFEIRAQNRTFARLYDGNHGWKLHPGRNGSPELKPYSDDELRFAREGQGIDGPLMDHQSRGIVVALDGSDEVEGRKAYRLNVTLPSGASHHVWIDAQSFLDLKEDRKSNNAFGQSGTVSVLYRDYRTVDGLQLPFVIESGAGSGKPTDRMVIDKIQLNPPLDDALFARPEGYVGTADAGHSPPFGAVRSHAPDMAFRSEPNPGGVRP